MVANPPLVFIDQIPTKPFWGSFGFSSRQATPLMPWPSKLPVPRNFQVPGGNVSGNKNVFQAVQSPSAGDWPLCVSHRAMGGFSLERD
jgi:hypothetical protein